jgi:hypothetical protein
MQYAQFARKLDTLFYEHPIKWGRVQDRSGHLGNMQADFLDAIGRERV